MVNIHPFALVDPTARLGKDVEIGPYSVIEPGVVIGDGCQLAARVVIKTGVEMGVGNKISEGTVLGGIPQHGGVPFGIEPSQLGRVVLGNHNTVRENVTIHRALAREDQTTLADSVYLMGGVHIAHDCRIESNVTIAQNTTLGGHVSIGERAFLSGLVAIHPGCRVGKMAIVGAAARVMQDVPPYVTIDGVSHRVVGLNRVGLKRNGFTTADFLQLKAAYRLIFRSGLRWTEVMEQLKVEFTAGPATHFLEFLAGSQRGFVYERKSPAAAVVRMSSAETSSEQSEDDEPTRAAFARTRKKCA